MKLTADILRKTLARLNRDYFICFALERVIRHRVRAIRLLGPYFVRDNISPDGGWTYADDDEKPLPFSREEWLRKLIKEFEDAEEAAAKAGSDRTSAA